MSQQIRQRFQQQAHMLGSEVVITLVDDSEAHAEQLLDLLWQTIIDFENQFSRFKPGSELNKINQSAGQSIVISRPMRKMLSTVKKYMKLTNGLFNPFVLPALQQAGYVGSWPHPEMVTDGIDYRSRQHLPAVNGIELSGHKLLIPADSALDLGGIGKGYLLDQLALILDEHSVEDYWLSLGGDLLVSGKDINDQPWKISVDGLSTKLVIEVEGTRQAIATSGTTKRRGSGWHHLISPMTGMPAQTDVTSSTVIAPSGVAADIGAKCLILGGPAALALVRDKLAATRIIIQRTDGSVVDTNSNQPIRENKGY